MDYKNRTGVYVAFDGGGERDPTAGDIRYYNLLKAWSKNKPYGLIDSHKKSGQVRDSSKKETLERSLLERLKLSKVILVILTKDTGYDRGMLNFEIENAVDRFGLPIIVAYTGIDEISYARTFSNRWPRELEKRINNSTAKCLHIPFSRESVLNAIEHVGVNQNSTLNKLGGCTTSL